MVVGTAFPADRTRPAPGSRRRRWRLPGVVGLLPLVILLAVWQFAGDSTSLSFPPPSAWIDSLGAMQQQGVLWRAIGTTLTTFVVSLIVAVAIGVALGVAIGGSERLKRALNPTLEFIRAVPPPALVPVVAIILGVSLTSGVTVVVIAIVWPILLGTATGMRAIPPVRREMARSVGLTRGEQFWKITLPSLVPSIFTGTRVAVSISLVVTLLADILGAGTGLGALISERQQSYDAASVWGLLLVIGLFGYLLNALLDIVGRFFRRDELGA
ncbi:ABC transporter permease [Pseudonocardia dioxanivorans]|jgi:ABC-type nitrate/sulfonate/bicarbonate transport system permease component|uniref:ABC transporter permease n=1 Tax=Pseudonocardia dioxanivorans TaxID=240495 RepID=UPI000CD240C2|nr:ABC transporter permease [Pseudonocardia dioxanivorans]